MILAAGDSGGNSFTLDPTSLIQFGILGIILLLILFGYLWAKPSVDQLQKDKAAAEKSRDEMVALMSTEVLPLLSETKDKTLPAINALREQLSAVAADVTHGKERLNDVYDEVRGPRARRTTR
jgi:uncharacterized membrane protein